MSKELKKKEMELIKEKEKNESLSRKIKALKSEMKKRTSSIRGQKRQAMLEEEKKSEALKKKEHQDMEQYVSDLLNAINSLNL